MVYELISPCHFGLEAVLKREIYNLGYDVTATQDGRVTFKADEEGIARCSIGLRTCERILLKAGEFKARTFDELFEGIKAIEWERYIPKDGRFWVKKASSVKSKIFSPRDIQSIVKKAIADRLGAAYGTRWLEESGNDYPLRIFILNDTVTAAIDASGESMHKRGYRTAQGEAPISETLAAALIMLTPWKGDRILVDPFCGSGTFCIEAAMMAADMAPGLNRNFLAEKWDNIMPRRVWESAEEEAADLIRTDIKTDIQGCDIDENAVKIAGENAKRAGVLPLIHFKRQGIENLSRPEKYGFIITNPPYGERMEDKESLPEIYRTFGERFRALDDWSAYMITSYEDARRYFGMKEAKNRKIYNGMIRTYFYQYPGAKPPARAKKDR